MTEEFRYGEHADWCPRPGSDAWVVDRTDLIMRRCRGCGMHELVLPADDSTPQARYLAGLPRRGAETKRSTHGRQA